MKKRYALLLTIFFGLTAFSQVQTNYSAKWFLGLNTGGTWQTTDVRNQTNSGFGFYLGRSFNYDYGRFASIDLRARFLRGFWYGQDYSATDFTNPNDALSQDPTNYKDSLGFSVNNFQAETYRFSLEMALHANRLRERTRWDPYIFGGIGLTWFQTYGDLIYTDTVSGAQNLYQYSPNYITKSTVKNTTDGVYETALDGSNQNKYTLNAMPSLGFGIGYQLGRSTTIGLEHKTTFTGIDDFDGVVKSGKYAQDLYHYTNFYVQFRFGRDKYRAEENDNQAPEVNFTSPLTSFKEIRDSVLLIQAEVKHVFSKENLTFIQNNQANTVFGFNEKTDRFTAQVDLVPGQNVFILIGFNQYGQDSDTLIVDYKKASVNNTNGSSTRTPPVVTYQQPSSSPLTVNTNTYFVQATVINVVGKQNVSMTVNGAARTDFQYDVNSKRLTANIPLVVGSNEVKIKATNTFGMDEESTILVYQRPVNQALPTVQFTDPANSPLNVTATSFQVRARIQNVNSSNFVQFKQNGSQLSGFQYNASTGDFYANVYLVAGNNLFELYGTNESGTASDQTVINYNRAAPKPPVVSIIQPSQTTSSSTSPTVQLIGRVLNVTLKSQVTLTVNGQNNTNFSFNANDGGVSSAIQLVEGSNLIRLSGSNSDGMDSKEITVIYRPAQTEKPPVVQFVSPSSTPVNVTQNNYSIQASVANVNSANGVQVKVNGTAFGGFSFSNGLVNFNLNLVQGANVIEVLGTNSVGSDSKTTTIYYQKPQTVNPPVVTYIQPSVNPSSYQQANTTVIAKVENVLSKSDVLVKINGQTATNFVYSTSSKQVSFEVVMVEGSNSIEVKGTNSAGSDSKTTLLVYRPKVAKPPVVQIYEPIKSPYQTQVETYTVKADIGNVDNASQIKMTVNGVATAFNYNAAMGKLDAGLKLVEGDNRVVVSATNTDGSAEDQTILVYSKPVVVKPPTVVFTNPSEPGKKVNNVDFKVEAKVFNIESAQQIQFKMNGSIIADNLWSFDASTKVFSYDSKLQLGNNVFEISATNTGGKGTAQTTLVYERPIDPCKNPIIRFTNPLKSGTTTIDASILVKFEIDNQDASTQVVVNVNGTKQTNFVKVGLGYEMLVNLTKGNNAIQVSANNQCGSATASVFLTYQPIDIPCLNPMITLLQPNEEFEKVEEDHYSFVMGVSHVKVATGISLKVNNQNVAIEWDAAAQIVRSKITLKEGVNTIELTASNDCGATSKKLNIERFVCKTPTIALISTNIPNGNQTSERQLILDLALNHITSSAQITVRLNNQLIPFDFDLSNQSLSIDRILNLGSAKVKVTAKNDCGSALYEHSISIVKTEGASPTLVFVNPATSNLTVEDRNFQAILTTSNLINSSQVLFKMNGVVQPVQFDFATQKITVNLQLSMGNNVFEVVVANNAGSVTANSSIELTAQKAVLQAPEIVLNGTYSKIENVALGLKKVSGKVAHLSDPSGFTVKVNGRALQRVNTKIVNGELIFDFTLNVVSTTPTMVVELVGKNEVGRDQQYLTFKVETRGIDAPIKTPAPVIKPRGGR
ncbi:MAG: hypothetical protein KJ941_07340 [Bacteroidetes bacterium]|nr:hypothetical protein [Bacteroidota bacterium]